MQLYIGISLGLLTVNFMIALFTRKQYQTINYKIAIQNIVLTAGLMCTIAVLFQRSTVALPWMIVLTYAVCTYFLNEQILTGHTLNKLWHQKYWLGISIVLIICALFIGIAGDVLIGLGIAGGCYFLWAGLDRHVFTVRGSEIELADYASIRTATSVARRYPIKLSPIYGYALIGQVVAFGWSMAALSGGACVTTLSAIERIITIAGAVFYFGILIYTPFLDAVGGEYSELLNLDGTILHLLLGYRAGMLQRKLHLQIDEAAAKDVLKKYSDEALSFNGVKPHVIVIMDEAFSDLRIWGACKTQQPVWEYLDAHQQEFESGRVIVSVLGGNTVYTEYEFLTGNSTKGLETMPYSERYIKAGEHIDSVVDFFNALGYETIAAHSFLRENWRRPVAYQAMGFQKQLYLPDFQNVQKIRGYCSDQSHFEQILQWLKMHKPDQPQFQFHITMQNHGGYQQETLEEEIRLEEGDDLPDLQTYLSLIHQSDQAFGRLLDELRDFPEPVVVCMFGDHQPKLSDEAYTYLDPEYVSAQKKFSKIQYTVPYYIWGNTVFHSQVSTQKERSVVKPREISMNYLALKLLEYCGIPRNAFGNFLNEQMQKRPIVSKYFISDTETITEEEQNVINWHQYHRT